MRFPPDFNAVIDEPFPETAEIIERKHAIRKTAGLLHESVESVQAWLDRMHTRVTNLRDPED